MNISQDGIDLLVISEGLRLTAYKDTGGVWTIGFGTTKMNGVPVKEGDRITESIAHDLMRQDLGWVEKCIEETVQVPLLQNQYDALCSFIYNIGEQQWKRSTFLSLLNEARYTEAADQFHRWRFDNGKEIFGLVKRRERERELFLRSRIAELRYPFR